MMAHYRVTGYRKGHQIWRLAASMFHMQNSGQAIRGVTAAWKFSEIETTHRKKKLTLRNNLINQNDKFLHVLALPGPSARSIT
jgi:uncharacterized protein (DUF2225 family)